MEKNINSYDLPNINIDIQDKISIKIPLQEYESQLKINPEQYKVFSMILDCIQIGNNFIIDESSGTQKRFLYHALLAHLRSKILIAFVIVISRVATTIMPEDRTAHSRFKILIDANQSCKYTIITIFMDKIPIAKRWPIKNVDKLLKNIMKNDEDFGGKIIIFCGDFRQVLLVVPNTTIS
ncbi:hypothetical protein Pfo_020345 [Paulownia fortunei]|nr:hypothetical protein Pfo_020345 [Paulownia fortunei]